MFFSLYNLQLVLFPPLFRIFYICGLFYPEKSFITVNWYFDCPHNLRHTRKLIAMCEASGRGAYPKGFIFLYFLLIKFQCKVDSGKLLSSNSVTCDDQVFARAMLLSYFPSIVSFECLFIRACHPLVLPGSGVEFWEGCFKQEPGKFLELPIGAISSSIHWYFAVCCCMLDIGHVAIRPSVLHGSLYNRRSCIC